MNKAVTAIIIVFAVVAAVGIGVFLANSATNKTEDDNSSTNTSDNSAETDNDEQKPSDTEPAATITYTDSGFEIEPSTVPVGSVITVKNESSADLELGSDPHPVHTDNEDLNANTIGPGEETEITVDEAGTWGFHNHLNEKHHGELIVE